ncbi:hypothetical protein AMJ97_CH03889 [Rhizobium sp. N1314]|nr:hypothetical protein AMK02_CH03891 [Rhizobium sp. N731]ANL17659.1 hypothetical protein AMJ97_CH03889 [Rhizobium sp. N1314]
MAAEAWHREEPREVRPFFQSVQAEDALTSTGIKLFENGDVLQDVSFDLDEIDFKKLQPTVSIAIAEPKQWMPAGLKAQDLDLVLVVRHGFLKRSEIVHRTRLSDGAPSSWEIPAEVLERLGGGRNVHITLALCLSHDRSPKPGSPFVPGHWLAKKTFVLRSRTIPTLFDVRTRTDEEWVAAGYPPKTYYAVEYTGGIETELGEGDSVAIVWVHADAHNKMVSSSLGECLQPMLGAEIISTILLESFKDWKESTSVEPASPLATLLKQLGKEKPLTLDGMKSLVGRPPLIKAMLQDRLSVLAALR